MSSRINRISNAKQLSRRSALKAAGLGAAGLGVAGLGLPRIGGQVRAQDQITLRYQNHWSKETDAHYEGMNWLYESFHAANPGITIENILNPDSQESRQKILADCAAGDCPDIIHEAGADMWEGGYLLDLTPHLDADPDWKAQLDPNVLGTTATDGQIWALSGEVSPMSTIWNTRILEEAGVSAIPTTWDELLAASEQIVAIGKLPTSWEVGGVHQFNNILASQPGGLDAIAAGQFDAPQVVEAFTRLKVFVDNGWVPANELELTWQQSVALFVAEETAFYLNGAWTIGNEITGEGAAPDLADNVAFTPYVAVGENGTTVETKQTTGIGLAASLAGDEAKLDAAITFFKHWFNTESATEWILLTRSPMGVTVDFESIEGVDPMLISFLSTVNQADHPYSLPGTRSMQERGWDHPQSGLDTLLAGGGVEEAVETYVLEMSNYAVE
ncbi:MAG: extracellular solute-binding protein [Thermomicrobiales bacterium]|nr:extracellular solute-binding protein [Thermomicrobiales bacterium]